MTIEICVVSGEGMGYMVRVEKFRKANLNLLKVEIQLAITQYLNVELDNLIIQKLQTEAKY
jgi:hypothetical protein